MMKKNILIAFSLIALVNNGMAQRRLDSLHVKKHPYLEQKLKKIDRRVVDSLGLTTTQLQEIKDNKQSLHTQLAQLKKDSSITAASKKAKAEQLKKEFAAKQNSILTIEQQAKLKQLKQQDKGGKVLQKMQKELQLTTQQKSAAAKIHSTYTAKEASIKADAKLSDEARKTQLQALHKQQKSELQALLTEQQKAKMDSLKLQMPKNKKHK